MVEPEHELEHLRDHVRIWQVDPVGHSEALVAAARGAAAVSELPALRRLAEEGAEGSRTRLADLVAATAEELELEPLAGATRQDAAVAAMARRLTAHEVTPRELTYWVTRVVGLRGGDGTRSFLTLEQEYCDRLGEEVTDLDVRVREAAAIFVTAGETEPSHPGRLGLLARLLRRRD